MTTSAAMTQQSLTTADLTESGFAVEQVDRLVALRADHSPFREQFSEREYRRLNFVRWRIDHGLLLAGPVRDKRDRR